MARLVIALLVAMTPVACGGETATSPVPTMQVPGSELSPTSTFAERVLAPRRNRAATSLEAVARCDSGSEPVVHLSWRPARDQGRAQRVAVTRFADGFETGRFDVSERLSSNASRYDWRGTTANGAYRWRVLTRHRAWIGSAISSFIGPSCGVEDYG